MSENDQHQYKDRYMLRLPDGMRDRIKAAAAVNGRSMNTEIVELLEEKFPAPLSGKEILIRAVLIAHMLRRVLVRNEMSEEEYFKAMTPIFFALKENGFKGTADELETVKLEDALEANIDVATLLDWSDKVRHDFDAKYPPGLFPRTPHHTEPKPTGFASALSEGEKKPRKHPLAGGFKAALDPDSSTD